MGFNTTSQPVFVHTPFVAALLRVETTAEPLYCVHYGGTPPSGFLRGAATPARTPFLGNQPRTCSIEGIYRERDMSAFL